MDQLLIVAALKDEVRDFKSKLAIDCTLHFKPAVLYKGKVFNKEVNLLVTGMGAVRMQRGLEEALDLVKPKVLLLTGYAGGASPLASAGSLVLAKEVFEVKGGPSLQSDGALLELAQKVCEARNLNYQVGNLVTVDRVIANPHEKAAIGTSCEALGLEMEAFPFAGIAHQKNVPWLVVKSILDPLEMLLPSFEEYSVKEFFKKPKEMLKLPHLQYLAYQARRQITKFLKGFVAAQ